MTSHPTAACPVANALYWKWVRVAEKWDHKFKVFQDAKAEYTLHLTECDKCTVLLNKYSNFVKEAIDD